MHFGEADVGGVDGLLSRSDSLLALQNTYTNSSTDR